MANPNILLQGLDKPQGMDALYRGVSQGNEIAQIPMQNALLKQRVEAGQQGIDKERAAFQLQDAAIDAYQVKQLLQTDPARAKVYLANRFKKIQDRGGDPSDTAGVIQALDAGNLDFVNAELDAVIGAAQQVGLFGPKTNTAMAEFTSKAAAAGLKPGTPEYERAARVDLGLDARAGTVTGQERIATTPGMTEVVAGSEGVIAGAKSGAQEAAKLGQQSRMLPNIRAAIKEAEQAASSRGESLSEYNRAKAAMPGLVEVSNKLKALSDVATYTMGGKAFDAIVKEMGFGSTEGANARTAMISIVDNQVLPLLRDTFGAAFTAAEGERLRNTLLDPDMAPEQKKASLDAFIEQKYRNLETKERELGIQPLQQQQQQPTGGVKFMGFE